MSSNILVLGAIAIILVLVLFGFLLGLLRGFRKSLYFTIIFIAVVILSFIFATALAKSVYSGSTLWRFAKKVIPESMKEGSEGVNSLKEFIRFYLKRNYTEILESGMTAGESICANDNAMGIIDGLIVMILKIVMLIGSYIILSILFYLLFGLIYLLFLRPKKYIETETVTDEDGNETVTEREVKPKKKRLAGGLIGGLKGFAKAMIILIPISFAIGLMAQVEIPTNSSSASIEAKYATSSKAPKSLEEIVDACKQYDNTLGKVYFGLDNYVMDKIISYDVKDSNGKKVKVTLSKEVSGFINIYNTLEKEIGVDNLKDYKFKDNLNTPEMKKVVRSITDNLSKSNALTTLLTAVGDEGSSILKTELAKKDVNTKYLFEEIKLNDKDSKWWSEQIEQIADIYDAFADLNLDYNAFDTKEYNLAFKDTESAKFDKFIDELFNNELVEMFAGGGLKYAMTKLPNDYAEVQETTNQVVKDKEVNEELKAFTGFVDILKEDIKFKDGAVDTDLLTINVLNKLTHEDKAILKNSKIVGKLVTVLLKNSINQMKYNGVDLGINPEIFNDANFKIHDEVKALATVLTDGFTKDYSIGNLKNMGDTAEVRNICGMLESTGMQNSVICNEIFSKMMPLVLITVAPEEDFDDVVWKNEYKSISGTLGVIYGENEKISNLSNLNFETLTYGKLNDLAESEKIWNSDAKVITKILNAQAIPFVEDMITNKDDVDMDYTDPSFSWQKEIKAMTNVGLWASDTDGVIDENDYSRSVSDLNGAISNEISDGLLQELKTDVPKSFILQDVFADTLITNSLITKESDVTNWDNEMTGLVSVATTMEEDNKLELNKLSTISEVKVKTIDELKTNTHKSVVLMNSMAKNLNEPMSTPNMTTWNEAKWENEMPHIGDVLKSLATNPADAESTISISDANMGEDTEIKKVTFEQIEDNIAYSEALQNMFKNAMKDIEDSSNTKDIFPNPTSITTETYSAWWDAEITGLCNVIYVEMKAENKTSIKLSEFSDTDSVKAGVVKSLSATAFYRDTTDSKTKEYSTTFSQHTNMGVSEYLQYMFKPQLRDLSKNGDNYFTFSAEVGSTVVYNWDNEVGRIMNVFLTTQQTYDTTNEVLVELGDNDSVDFDDEVNFKLRDASDPGMGGNAKYAALLNKAILASITNNIDGTTYLQYVLAPEMKRMMNGNDVAYAKYIAKNPAIYDGNKTNWTNSEWVNETSLLNQLAIALINDDSPKMEGLDFYKFSQEEIELICDITPKSYLLQSKMAKPLVEAGITFDSVVVTVYSTEIPCSLTDTIETLTGSGVDLMEYIVKFEWTNGVNEAYAAVMDSMVDEGRRNKLKALKDCHYTPVGKVCTFYDTDNTTPIIIIDGETGTVTDGTGSESFLTDDVSTKTNAVKTYAEYCLMIKSLADRHEPTLNEMIVGITTKLNDGSYDYHE